MQKTDIKFTSVSKTALSGFFCWHTPVALSRTKRKMNRANVSMITWKEFNSFTSKNTVQSFVILSEFLFAYFLRLTGMNSWWYSVCL